MPGIRLFRPTPPRRFRNTHFTCPVWEKQYKETPALPISWGRYSSRISVLPSPSRSASLCHTSPISSWYQSAFTFGNAWRQMTLPFRFRATKSAPIDLKSAGSSGRYILHTRADAMITIPDTTSTAPISFHLRGPTADRIVPDPGTASLPPICSRAVASNWLFQESISEPYVQTRLLLPGHRKTGRLR